MGCKELHMGGFPRKLDYKQSFTIQCGRAYSWDVVIMVCKETHTSGQVNWMFTRKILYYRIVEHIHWIFIGFSEHSKEEH